MSYSKSKKAVRKVQSYLDQMLTAEANLVFPDKNPTRLNYKIREGISASQYHLDTKKYSNLNSKFIIRNSGIYVMCEIRDTLELEMELLQTKKPELTFPDVAGALEILTVAIKNHSDIMIFPDASYSEVYTPLSRWAEKNGYEIKNEDGIKLIKNANPKEDNHK